MQEGSSPAPKKPNPVDIFVGSRVRMRRKMMGMSQEKLGEKLGITFQQIQKYEKGTNRIGASRLEAISRVLDVPIAYFFPEATASGERVGLADGSDQGFTMDMLSSAEGLDLNRAFFQIDDPKVRRKVIDLVRSIAGDSLSKG